MGLIHEKFYQSDNLAQIDFASYLQSLANFLVQSYRGKSENTTIQIEAEKITLNIDMAIPCGLIVNELLSNSLKYAFPNGRKGKICIQLRTNFNREISLQVTDDGVGLPDDFDLLHANSLGLQLVRSLVTQLDGKLEIQTPHGTSFQILFSQ